VTRQFSAGDEFDVHNIHYRVVAGYKGPDDLRLEWCCAGAWQPVHMAHAAVHTAFFCENEDVLYPWPAAGGNYFLGFLHTSARRGWIYAVNELQNQKENKHREAS
jgi:hypothetical protein